MSLFFTWFFAIVFRLFFVIQRILPIASKDDLYMSSSFWITKLFNMAARYLFAFTSLLSLCFFASFEFHEYLKLLRFQQVSCPESEVRHLSTTFQPLQNLDICIFNAIVFVFLSWDYLYVLELPSFFCNLFSISIFK